MAVLICSHEWVFITDTSDAVYENSKVSVAFTSQLANKMEQLPGIEDLREESVALRTSSMREPFLKQRRISNICELEPFFSHISIYNYEYVYSSTQTFDKDVLITNLLNDMFI